MRRGEAESAPYRAGGVGGGNNAPAFRGAPGPARKRTKAEEIARSSGKGVVKKPRSAPREAVLTDFEKERQDNIRRNQEALAALMVKVPDDAKRLPDNKRSAGVAEPHKKRFKSSASTHQNDRGGAGALTHAGAASPHLTLLANVESRLETLREKRKDAVAEIECAEKELVISKTAVEEAEAVYNAARARASEAASAMSNPAGASHHHHHHHHHHHQEEGHTPGADAGADEEDWDKYLEFGEGDGDGDQHNNNTTLNTALPGVAPATAHEQHVQQQNHQREAERAATAAALAAASVAASVAAAALAANQYAHPHGMRATAAAAAAAVPLADAEAVLLAELKKLEAANARVVASRRALESIEAQIAEAIADRADGEAALAVLAAEKAARDEGDLDDDDEEEENDGGGHRRRRRREPERQSARVAGRPTKSYDEDEAMGDEEAEDPRGEDGEENDASAGEDDQGAAHIAATFGIVGKVIEDRRFGIYDSRRYRTVAPDGSIVVVPQGGYAVRGGAGTMHAEKHPHIILFYFMSPPLKFSNIRTT